MKRDMTGGAVVMAVLGGARRRRLPGPGDRAGGRRRERRRRRRAASRRRAAPLRRPHQRGHQHRRRGPAGARRRAGLRRRRSSTPPSLVDVATLTGAMKVALGQQVGGFFANDEALAAAISDGRRGRRRAAVAVPAGRATTRRSWPRRSPTPTTRPAARARSPPRCSSSTSSATCRGRTSTSPRSATRPPSTYEWTTGPDRLRCPRAARTGSARATRSPGSESEHARPDRPLVAGRRARRRRGGARGVRRGHLPRPVHRHGGAALQDLADAAGRVVRGLLRLRLRRGARRVPGAPSRPAPRTPRARGSSAARRS